MVDQAVHEGLALLKLIDGDIFIGLMGHGDIAGAADRGGIAAFLKLASLGAVTNNMGAVVAGELADQRFRDGVVFRAQAGAGGVLTDLDARLGYRP